MSQKEHATLMQRYFRSLSERMEHIRPSPGPACVGQREPSCVSPVQRSERKIKVTAHVEDTPGPFLQHQSLGKTRNAVICRADRWSGTQARKAFPGPNKYSVENHFESKNRRSPSPELNTTERFKRVRQEKRPDYYFDASYEAVLPDVRAGRINRSQRCTDSWMM